MSCWRVTKDCDPVAMGIFRRHYSYRPQREQLSLFAPRNRNKNHFVGPGQKLVLLNSDESALFVWRKFISMNSQSGVNCAVFRNEGSSRSSDLIRCAMEIAWQKWPGERLYTYVNPRKVKSRNPGYCFIAAGWNRCGITKSKKLLILEALA